MVVVVGDGRAEQHDESDGKSTKIKFWTRLKEKNKEEKDEEYATRRVKREGKVNKIYNKRGEKKRGKERNKI